VQVLPAGAIPADAVGSFSTGYDNIGDEDGLPASPADAAMMDEVEREIIDKASCASSTIRSNF
jgi:hypothetical protein